MPAPTRPLLVLAFILASASVLASDGDFESNFKKASDNAQTETGAAYDAALGAAFDALPDFGPKMMHCLEESPGQHAVRGYFLFVSAKDYQVVLDPKDALSACLSKVLSGRPIPAPPSIPYLNPFTLTTPP